MRARSNPKVWLCQNIYKHLAIFRLYKAIQRKIVILATRNYKGGTYNVYARLLQYGNSTKSHSQQTYGGLINVNACCDLYSVPLVVRDHVINVHSLFSGAVVAGRSHFVKVFRHIVYKCYCMCSINVRYVSNIIIILISAYYYVVNFYQNIIETNKARQFSYHDCMCTFLIVVLKENSILGHDT